MLHNRIVVILILIFCLTTVCGQETYKFNQLTTKDGLSDGMVTCILQDKKGFIWIGTDNGLNKYDGYQIHIYKHNIEDNNSIGANTVRCLYEDSRNNLWIGLKGGGLSRLNMTTGLITNYKHADSPNGLSSDDVSGIVEDKSGNLWIAVDRGGLDMLDRDSGKFTNYILQDSSGQLLNNGLTDISLDSHGRIWLSSWGSGLYCFDIASKKFNVFSEKQIEICDNIFDIFMDNSDNIWIASLKGLFIFNTDEVSSRHYVLSKKEYHNTMSIHSILTDKNGNIWIGTTERGLYLYDSKNSRLSTLNPEDEFATGMLSHSVNCLYEDNDGNIWIGTNVGLNFYNPLSFQFTWIKKQYTDQPYLSDNQVFSLLKDKNKNIWIGETNGIDKISADRKTVLRYSSNDFGGSDFLHHFQSSCETKQGMIYIGSYADFLIKYNPVSNKFSKIAIPPPPDMNIKYRNVYSIYEDYDETLWLSTELGVVNYNPVTNVFKPLFESSAIIYPEEKAHVVYRSSDMALWVGTEAGLFRYSPDLKLEEKFVRSKSAFSLNNDFITVILEDSKGILWIGTKGGLHRYDKEHNVFYLIKRPDNIYGDPVLGLCEDTRGILWMSTTSGIIKYDAVNGTFFSYDESDGLQNRDFQTGAFFCSDDGELMFGGKGGFNTFYPERLKINERKPPVRITDFQIFNRSVIPEPNGILTRPVGFTDKIKIKHSQSVISFHFVALNYVSPHKNQYQYKMEGFDKEWITANPGQRSVTYTNLNAGEYRFMVKATNNDGIMNDEPAVIGLTISPPFWASVYAYLLYFVAFCLMVYLLIVYFTVRERDKNNLEIAKLETKRIREMDEMKFNLFTNISHEFRTPLSLISGPLKQIINKKSYNKEDEKLYTLMWNNSQRLLRLINQFLDFRKIESAKLELIMKYDDLVRFVSDLAATFSNYAVEKKIRFYITSTLSNLWMNFDSDKLDKILYNLISNAFQYTPDGGRIEVNISEIITDNKRYAKIRVSDTGIGIVEEEKENIFTAFYQSKRRKILRNDGSGIGLALTKELVELHSGIITVESKVNQGSVFTVELPVSENDYAKEIIAITDFMPHKKEPELTDNISASNLLLIVEDNSDMRIYLENILSHQFKLLMAKDGQEAMEKAVEFIPDLIISDIMMPVMDGMELVKSLKKNDKTNHIPVILLTAKQQESSIIEGYKAGIDDYITKPFSAEMIEIRINNILSLRKELWKQYRQSGSIEEYKDKLAENPQKQAFVYKINEIITQHISDSDFNVEMLADDLKMSGHQLSRKVRALMDTTPYNVILKVRMSCAARMIEETDLNISEIAYSVGYQELSNFSRAFKKYHKMSPRKYFEKSKSGQFRT